MTYNSALEIGRSALFASQAAMQIAGHNLANAATPGFHRRSIHLLPAQGGVIGTRMYLGNGVAIGAINREIDIALQARFRASISREGSLAIDQQYLIALETLQNELSETDLSSALDAFFGSFSELGNTPGDSALRTIALQQGEVLAGRLNDLASGYANLSSQVSSSVNNTVDAINELLEQVAVLNGQIGTYEGSGNEASELRDQRDMLLDQLSQYMDIEVVEQSGGMVDVKIGSVPILIGDQSRGIEARMHTEGADQAITIHVASDGTDLQVGGGTLHGLLRQHAETIAPALETLNTLAFALIHEVNRLHSQGQGERGWSEVTGTVSVTDPTAVLNAADNGVAFPIENGTFSIHLRDPETNEIVERFDIAVDGDSMTLEDLVQAIENETGGAIDATIDGDGRLVLSAPDGMEMTFSDDTSGVLSALGINTFFTGSSAADIDVSAELLASPELLAISGNNIPGSADMALAIAGLSDTASGLLGGQSITEFWSGSVGTLAVRTGANAGMFQSSSLVRESLGVQMMAVSGVSIDEETINLMAYERQFQAAARYLAVVDETLETLMKLV